MNDITEPSSTDELPLFPTSAPAVFDDPAATIALIEPVLSRLADVVDVDPSRLSAPTPCRDYDVGELRTHVLAWLTFFAAALSDPQARSARPAPDTWRLPADAHPSAVVERASAVIVSAIEAGVSGEPVTMSEARMLGSGVLAMALGEYIVHGWDLASSTGRPWDVDDAAADAARAFLETTVAPEHRGADSGFFDDEVMAPAGATPLERLLCFAGRDPHGETSA
jgi:uncharacterized protein (TIGR03086 family)